jgi:TRAP-type C4-dicarboxylate transport system substrate-binding protein
MQKLEMLERGTEAIQHVLREEMRTNREENSREAREGRQEMGNAFREMQSTVSESLLKSFKDFREGYEKGVESLSVLQREMFSRMDEKQERLIANTGKQLDEMRQTVDEKRLSATSPQPAEPLMS